MPRIPMYPIGSNGASQAILDADALVRALRANADPIAALSAYEAERLPATAAIVRANRQNGPEHCMQLAEERAPKRLRPISTMSSRRASCRRWQTSTRCSPE